MGTIDEFSLSRCLNSDLSFHSSASQMKTDESSYEAKIMCHNLVLESQLLLLFNLIRFVWYLRAQSTIEIYFIKYKI